MDGAGPAGFDRLLVLGSGKIARDLGLLAARAGHRVAWRSRGADRLAALERRIARDLRREPEAAARASFVGPDAALPRAGLVIECLEEDLAAKRAAAALVAEALPGVPLATVSSSILPSEMAAPGQTVVGLHVFYPLHLTRLVERIEEGPSPADLDRRLDGLARGLGLAVLRQDARRAFAANRLLLPLQAECLRLVRAGVPAPVVDEASRSEILPLGQLSLIDAVGPGTVAASARRYLARMPATEARDLEVLPATLDELVGAGRQGQRNGQGLLVGDPLPWPAGGAPADDLAPSLEALFRNTCRAFLRRGELDGEELGLLLLRLHGFAGPALPPDDELLTRRHAATGIGYWSPA